MNKVQPLNAAELNCVRALLDQSGLAYAVIGGRYEDAGSRWQLQQDALYGPDIDILFLQPKRYVDEMLAKLGWVQQQSGGFYYYSATQAMRCHIDVYYSYISYGWIKIFKPDKQRLSNNYIGEEDYLLYQLIEPLLKFGAYQPRHLERIRCYRADKKLDHAYVRRRQRAICFPCSFLLSKAYQHEGQLTASQYRMLKLSLILKPRNMIRYIRYRFSGLLFR